MDPTTNREAALLLARTEDLAEQCRLKCYPAFLGFLDEAQQALVAGALRRSELCHAFWGGAEGCERAYLGLFPWEEPQLSLFPIRCLEFTWRSTDVLTHRDFLGSLMGLQLKREAVGDILVEPGHAFVFLSEHAAPVVLQELSKVGRVGVTVCEQTEASPSIARQFQELRGTVSSLRLDCVVAFLGNLSRSSATRLIASGLVALNGTQLDMVDKTISPGDKLSIRGVGKFVFSGQDGVSRKDKLRLIFKKYI